MSDAVRADETEALRRRSGALDDERAGPHAAFAAPLGQGTGLSTFDGFAVRSDGPVRIDAGPGCGPKLKLYLRRHHGAAPPDTVAAGPTAPHRAARGDTVPVVEDDPVVGDLIVEVPGDPGYTALRVANARAGRD